MNKAFLLLISLIILSLLGINTIPMQARPLTALNVSLQVPASCPPGGCGAGQRINLRATFDVNPLNTTTFNTQVCVYTSLEGSDKWADDSVFSVTDTINFTAGEQSGVCTNTSNIPAGTQYLGGAYAQFLTASPRNFDFGFRINRNSTGDGSLLISIYRLNAAGDAWEITDNASSPVIDTAPSASESFVAADSSACMGNTPCYLNSGDDQANGIGTGLKDAVDARTSASTVNILGSYAIKGNSITINTAHTIQGVTNATLTYGGTQCNNAMLLVTAGATIQDLNINDGVCVSPSRDLVLINSPSNVTLRRNDLLNGKDAVSILDNNGNVSVRFNHIAGNSGYGILRTTGSSSGVINAVANNIFNNRIGAQAECNNKGEANHNFWGPGVNPATAISRCTYSSGKRLGAAILNDGSPGVGAQTATLTGSKQSYFSGSISLEGTAGVKLIVANHGNGSLSNIPFLGQGTENITACSNFYDVFVSDENTITPLTLNVFIQYESVCESIIETSPNYCGSTNSEDFPLLWYDPQYSVTNMWDTTGQLPAGPGATGMVGQSTTCDIASNEIKVAIDRNLTERPNLIFDLTYTPFVIGYPNQEIVYTTFTAVPGIARADLHWETSKEDGLYGFYVARSLFPYGPYNRDSDLIPAKGDAGIGGIYNYVDLELNNGTTYWYMLEMIDTSPSHGSLGFHGPVSASTYSMIPTATEVTPNSVEVYGSSLSIKIKGNNFIPSSVVVWDNNLTLDLTSSFISSTELTAILPASLYSAPGSSAVHEITVYNPGSGGGFSPPLTFTIKNPVPTLTSISPEVSDGNSTTISLTVKGDYFVDDSVVRFNGSSSNLTTTFIDRNNLTASILKSNLSAGIITVTVYNPTYGGGTSAGKTFNLYTPTPTLTKQPTSTKTKTTVYIPPPQRTRTRTPTRTSAVTLVTSTPSATPGLLTPSATLATPDLTNATQVTLEPFTLTPSLAPGEPTYTPAPPTPVIEDAATSVWNWRLMSSLRVLAGGILGAGLLAFPIFLVFWRKTRQKPPR